jgi:transcriptional regulator with XRE-family HTH domain
MIDGAQVRALRLDRGLSQRKLAAAAGVDPLTIKRIESGADGGELPLRVVAQLAGALGGDIAQVLSTTDAAAQEPEPRDLVVRLGSALLAGRATKSALCSAMSATLDELEAAAAGLRLRLQAAGMALSDAEGCLLLVPTTDIGTRPVGRSLNLAEARLLRRIHRGEDVRRRLTHADRTFVLPALLRLGLVDHDHQGLVVTAKARTAVLDP